LKVRSKAESSNHLITYLATLTTSSHSGAHKESSQNKKNPKDFGALSDTTITQEIRKVLGTRVKDEIQNKKI
jgi:hypothetical protein